MKKSNKKIIGLLLVVILLLSTQMISAKAASDAKLYTVKGHTITVKAKKGKDICGVCVILQQKRQESYCLLPFFYY